MGKFVVGMDDPQTPDVRTLLETHLAFAMGQSPPEDVHALDIPGLLHEDVSFFSIRECGVLLGVGALKEISLGHGELKSIHTAEGARGKGVGRSMVEHLLGVARARGYDRVSLETGTMDGFRPSRVLYESFGFEECEPFGDYFISPYSVCMTLELQPSSL
jgi:putative acetyltransferase